MEFLYPTENPDGFIKGFVDMFFEHRGKFFIIDWKSNYLEAYTPQKLQETISAHQYDLQAKLYATAAKKYLKLFKCEEHFEGVFYLFLRGLNRQTKGGSYFFPSD